MITYPDDIFSEPENVDPDTLANLGPLRRLAGVWEGLKGVDLNPKADGPERRDFLERIELQPIDPQANGPQLFYGLRYHVHIVASDEDTTFHDQIGYWLWEPATGLIQQTLALPRGQVALASGGAAADGSGADRQGRAGPARLWRLLDRLPGMGFPHRLLRAGRALRGRWRLVLCFHHDAAGSRPNRALPARGQEHADQGRRAAPQSAGADHGGRGHTGPGAWFHVDRRRERRLAADRGRPDSIAPRWPAPASARGAYWARRPRWPPAPTADRPSKS